MFVRVGLGISTDDVEVSLATIRETDSENESDMTTPARGVLDNAILNIMATEKDGPEGVWESDGGLRRTKSAMTRVA